MINGSVPILGGNLNGRSKSIAGNWHRVFFANALALGLPALVLYCRLVLMHYKAGDPPALILFLLPVIICAHIGGLWQGLMATLLSALAAGYFLLPPIRNLAITNWMHRIEWISMAGMGVLISLLVESLHRARKKNEQAIQKLNEQQTRLHGVISSAMDGIITVDAQHQITLFNSGAEKMFGCSAAEAVGQPLDRFMPERFRENHLSYINNFASTHLTHRMTGIGSPLYGLRANGEEFPIEVSVSQIDCAGQKLFTAIVRDVTHKKQAEEALLQNRDRLSLAMDVANLGTYDRYIPENRMEWSPRALAMMGLPPETPLSYEQYLELLTSDDRSRMELARTESWKFNRDFEVDVRIIWPDGSAHWLLVRGRPYRDEAGLPLRSSGIIQDITQQKKIEEVHLRSQKLESLGTLAGGIAHDFNNILLAIRGNADLASDDLPENHPAQPSLAEIRKSAKRATDLVRQILAFSRPQEQGHEILPLESVIGEAARLMRSTLPAMIEIRTNFPSNIPLVSVDPAQFRQVVVNLITNAAHAIGSRAGTIELSLRVIEINDESLIVHKLLPGRYVVFDVKDNGGGMDADTKARIFDPFFTTKPVGQGTGLGLSVVDGIVRAHGGAITLYSEPGKGTVFHVYLPIVGAMREKRQPSIPANVPSGENRHVLYVDDEEALVFLITRNLTRLGYKVTGFTDSEAALREFMRGPDQFDAIVTDLAMPRLSGFDLLREVLALRPNIPAIMTSGYVRPEDEIMARQIGVRRLIPKPDTTEKLGTELDILLRDAVSDRD